MTMQLVIGVGSSFLQELVQQTVNAGDIGQLATVMVGVIILAVIAHQLPKMVAGMVTGGGYGGHVGSVGVMTMGRGLTWSGPFLSSSAFALKESSSAGVKSACRKVPLTPVFFSGVLSAGCSQRVLEFFLFVPTLPVSGRAGRARHLGNKAAEDP
jgi:type IV secretory pathway TrbL component